VEEVEEVRGDGPLVLRPRELVGDVMLLLEDVPLEGLELGIAPGRDGETSHEDAVQEVVARGVIGRPGPIVEGRGGRDLDGVPLRETLDDQTGVLLGAAHDVGPVALHHHEEPPAGHLSPMR